MKYTFVFTLLILLWSCEERIPIPHPHAYPRVIYPEKQYEAFQSPYCDFQFDKPQYAKVERDTTFFDEKAKSDCWFNLDVPQLGAKIYCSYYPINNKSRFDELVQDAFFMANKHNIKALSIDEIPISRPEDKVYGVVFNIDGPVASQYQFFLTDTAHHFLRGALYFNTQARQDSLAPVAEFMKEDMNRIVETLMWKK